MTATELIAEGEAIARTAFVLGEQPNEGGIVACWGGKRADKPEKYPPEVTALTGRRHICTVSEELLRRLEIAAARPTGPVGLYKIKYANGESVHHAEGDGSQRFDDLTFQGATPLYATAIRSFPPFAALCHHGGERIGRWLAGRGFTRHDYWRADTPECADYDDEWQRRSPFYDPSAVLVVGGWHMLWPEDDFYMPPECRLLFMTQRDAEPWLEVWHGAASGGLPVKERIT